MQQDIFNLIVGIWAVAIILPAVLRGQIGLLGITCGTVGVLNILIFIFRIQ